ncbi:hypothetical protein [Sandarakinorhabdus sp. AAP62]|uniref:hypothetical protein n=1 Tax=Sandarakinorhabdus sp. AAP62 TaxID=1248916 RepID=UPI00030F3566|nr:hypothetical protein [Sandarakinorhabdus sp. AAP62]
MNSAQIDEAARRLGYRLGWRFMTCPAAWRHEAKLLLVTLNPGGDLVHGPSWSQEEGSAYLVESWDGCSRGASPLQRQVQAMFALAGCAPEEAFSAHLVPFRSPSWSDLEHRQEALSFSRELWRWLLPQVSATRVVCLGQEAGREIAALTGARDLEAMPTGWGNIQAYRGPTADGRELIILPHLSRFKLFNRPQSQPLLRRIFRAE